jgi:signal transduction histidine kinase
MEKEKEISLNETLDKIYAIGFGLVPDDSLEEYFAEKLVVFGTTVDEKYTTLEGMRKLIRNQKEQSAGLDITFERKELFRDLLANEAVASIADEVVITIRINQDTMQFYIRCSIIMEYKNREWKLNHWHASKPELVQSEEDTFGIDDWKQKTEELEKLVAERTADLVTKNRELEIETALEKVRSRTMAMRHSSELTEIIQVVYRQLIYIKTPVEHAGFIIDYKNGDEMKLWIADQHKIPAQISIPYFDSPHWNSFLEAKKSGADFFANNLNFEEKNRFYQKLFTFFPELPVEANDYYFNCPGLAISTVLLDNIGLYIENFSGTPYSPEENRILMRFGTVFQQAYTRFLDLEKAEAQAREAEIELALERVRARTMAMQQSAELADTASILFQQINGLGFETWSCGFGTWEENDLVELWMGAAAGGLLPSMMIPYKEELTHRKIYESFLQQEESHEQIWVGNALEQHYTFLRTIPSVAVAINQLESAGMSLPAQQCYYAGLFHGGYLLLITQEPNQQLNELSKRFAKVFEQTYTRFLDLKKAEAQAREAKIENALEKVRSRTMGMQHSDELADASFVLDSQVRALGIETWGCAFNIYGENESTEWFSSARGTLPKYKTPRENLFLRYYEAGQAGEPIHVETFKDEACIVHYEYLCTIPVMGDALKEMKESGGSFPTQQTDHAVYFKYGYLLFITLDPEPEAYDIFIRFAKVFEQTYTRFLDLQKAEAQSRESQIQLALERVRARTMAMQHSNELIEAADVMFQQVQMLAGDVSWNCGFNVWDEDKQWATAWNGTKLGIAEPFRTPSNEDVYKRIYDAMLNGESLFVEEMGGQLLVDHYKYLSALPVVGQILENFQKAGISLPTFQIIHVTYFVQGYLIFITYEPVPALHDIFKRFAVVFEQTYTRFLDLQKAEAQAMRAEQDVVAIKQARQKAEEALSDLQAAQKQLIQSEKMASLGELVAGIAHEIQNPINFVNNFSEVTNELVDEMYLELNKGDIKEAKALSIDIKDNLDKITHHGKRADAIVKGMLQHSRNSAGKKELTDINALCEEYLRLSYHGFLAKSGSCHTFLKTNFDQTIGKVNIIPQDIGRVIMNLLNNAFYAASQKYDWPGFEPTVSIATKKLTDKLEISVTDNGYGILEDIADKIFQPFFTTKPTGQGTGLGLSLSYDIMKAINGSIAVVTEEGRGSTFTINFPVI